MNTKSVMTALSALMFTAASATTYSDVNEDQTSVQQRVDQGVMEHRYDSLLVKPKDGPIHSSTGQSGSTSGTRSDGTAPAGLLNRSGDLAAKQATSSCTSNCSISLSHRWEWKSD